MDFCARTKATADDRTMSLPPKISHIAIAVRDLDRALPFYTEVLGLQVVSKEELLSEGVRIVHLKAENILIELLEPSHTNSPVHSYLNKYGEGLHHIAFETNDIEKVFMDLKAKDLPIVNEGVKKGARNSEILFIHPSATNGTLVEFCEYKGRREQ
ncbi:methylmalonyl-CoA epimerase [Oceanobacillus iheyensis]|uniref:Methylmalonyl-CoA epimerase n=1 Tax=Oceanobacillus jordanicus TaxID=2867266 RepID=A0AAW5B5X8_9BACI|nr:methylmalonyl-CoA epimerase [Oceanobacillus jordanicus]AVQ99312.1 methylmalonyl-CoA epimerase [Oceanobacillus iheyensis]MCG3418766.1 methylmalonyl-CoA epimerase [Oceanobacillus jordanicus]NAP01086.1 methylmalonyl-CoA epimerase [Halomonas sp. MG34]